MDHTSGLKTLFSHYAGLVKKQHMLEAIDIYYDDDIKQYENQQEPLIGKPLLRAKENAIHQNMIERTVDIQDVEIDEKNGIVTGRMIFEFKSLELGTRMLDETFRQVWKDGKIIEQKFEYDSIEDEV